MSSKLLSKKTLPFLILFLNTVILFGQNGFLKTYRVAYDYNHSSCIIHTNDNGYVLLGTGNAQGFWDGIIMVKIDSLGNSEWSKVYGDSTVYTHHFGYSVEQILDHNLLICGKWQDSATLIKTDFLGNKIWQENYNILGGTYQAKELSDSAIIMVGRNNNKDLFVRKTNKSGDLIWTQTISIPNTDNKVKPGNGQVDFIVNSNNDISILASLGSTLGNGTDMYLIKMDSSGAVLWSKQYGTNKNEFAQSICSTNLGGYALLGNLGDSTLLVKTDSNGVQQWIKKFSVDEGLRASSVESCADGGFIISGTRYGYDSSITSQTNTYSNAYGIKTDQTGNVQWQKTIISGNATTSTQALPISNGRYIFFGETYFHYLFPSSFLVLRQVDKDIAIKELAIDHFSINIYPNPLNSKSLVTWSNPQNHNFTLRLLNVNGQPIRVFKNLKTDHFTLNRDTLTPGLYFLILEDVQTQSKTVKKVIIK